MKRQIRKSVFETNSSSTHAICITKKKDNYKLPDHIDFEFGEFGWECKEYEDTYNKASYLITAIFSFSKSEADKKIAQLKNVLSDSEKLFRYLVGDSFIITGNDNDDDYRDRMCIYEGEEETDYGSYPIYGNLKPEFNDYEIYEKGN